ncbi:hypothetical protein AUEXF2481DRAFT_26707 [Aureobasidium subglaciale EXF-2481]|uniref:Uncharacterized protein n=1 Tax=Aureobasidium subglaciale (strain EXF-2481) TaxID=1043005 RepID=A0A074YKV7_AURSE|nr:uncharacterized protein AUEXF2481DRAFT_26707 [Aureobasidium subglaciale EXF-2481]KEQ98325.1 hypothetical protein AUEXF2481DRAFT_26707 [Aureobasidium subglaciale EXF-2481]
MDCTTDEYIQRQRGWLGRMHPAHKSDTDTAPPQPILDPESPQWHITQVFKDLLETKYDAQEAAQRLADTIVSSSDVLKTYSIMLGCFLNAVESFSSMEVHTLLSNFLAHLASLPDAVNNRPEPLIINSTYKTIIQPGCPIIVDWAGRDDHLWRDLPYLSMNITESMQGPEAYLSRDESVSVATQKWKNMNTFIAILVRDHGSTFPELFGSRIYYAFSCIPWALEYPPRSRWGKNMALHLPAACQWILLAADEVWKALDDGCEGRPWTMGAGQLWSNQDGGNEVDGRRWAFWRYRFEALSEDPRLDAETAEMALQVSRLM